MSTERAAQGGVTRCIFVNRYFYPDHSATSQLLSDLCFYLASEGYEVHVVTSRQRYDDPGAQLAPVEQVRGVQVHRVGGTRFGRGRLPGRGLDYLSFYVMAGWRLLRLARAGDVVVANTDPPLIGAIVLPLVMLKGARLINWIQDIFPEVAQTLGIKGLNGHMGNILQGLRNISLRRAWVNVVPGHLMKLRLEEMGVPSETIRVIPNWADGETIRPLAPDNNPLRAAWDLEGRFVVGYSGNMGRAHEFDAILVAAELLKSDADIVFLFIGGGAKRSWLEKEVEQRHLSNFLFQPYQSRKVLVHSLAVPDIHLITLNPLLEGLIVPSKFYGVAAAGRPALFIGAPDGEISQVIRENECGYVMAPADGHGLAEKIQSLAAVPEQCMQMGLCARQVFERRFNKPLALEAWHEVFRGEERSSL